MLPHHEMLRATAIRFLLVTGKGGTGKTTMAATLGLGFARAGRRALVVSSARNTELGAVLGSVLGGEARLVAPGLSAMLVDPEEAMREYVESALGSRRVAGALFHERFSGGFLHGIPGLRAWALLGKAWYQQQYDDAEPRRVPWDVVILDAPATGDSTDLLRVPRIISELAPLGRLKRDAEACWTLLRDPARSAVCAVTLPEELPVTETEELVALVRSDLGLPLGPLIVNQWSQPTFSDMAQQQLVDSPPDLVGPALRTAWTAGRRHALRERAEAAEVERLGSLGLEICAVPRFAERPVGLSALTEILGHLAGPFGFAPGTSP